MRTYTLLVYSKFTALQADRLIFYVPDLKWDFPQNDQNIEVTKTAILLDSARLPRSRLLI